MAQFTKKAIMDAFIELIFERAFDKITVKDIVTRCGVNRNTFYYYFEDIYALVDEIFRTETQKIIGSETDYVSLQEAFLKGIEFAAIHKQAIFHIYKSISREQVEDYLNKVTYNNVLLFIKKETADIDAPEDDREFLAKFYTHALVGLLIEWLGSDMKGEPIEFISRLGVLFDGNIRYSLSKKQAKP